MNDLLYPNNTVVETTNKEHYFIEQINLINTSLERYLVNIETVGDFSNLITQLAEKIAQLVKKYPDLSFANIMVNKKGLYTIRHSIDTALLASLVAYSMNKNERDIINMIKGCLTMNASLVKTHDDMHVRETLSREQKQLIHNHPIDSANLLKAAGVTEAAWLNHVLDHHGCDHENYPDFAKPRQKILESTKIIFIADRYCALISGRPYRKPFLPAAAIQYILTKAKHIIDPSLALCFMKQLGMYPPGTFVRLQNGDIAIVSHKTDKQIAPVMHSIVNSDNVAYDSYPRREFDNTSFRIREVLLQPNLPELDIMKIWKD